MSIVSLFGIIAAVLLGAVLLAAIIFAFTKLFGLTFVILRNIFRFIGEEVSDTLRFVGAILASLLFAPLVVLSIVIGRWSASKHYAGALMNELRASGRCVYRICIGNFARLFGVSQALEGVEKRVPEIMAAAPTRDKPSKRVGMFDGYKIVGSLKGGGSGGKLYIAEPDEVKQAVFAKRKLGEVDQVVIKVFSLKDGSSLPQIVRESRALDAARQLGLVLEHQMAPDRFYYVMRYVPGESLSRVTQRLHSLSSIEGLSNDHLHAMMSYAEDLLVALDTYHNAELWHKDVKPDNIIVDGTGSDAKAHLVDFGLITPMRSAMTLTTHGTEYFRDPELVRQALRGVKVHQIDGSKFDVYGAGAVLFSMIENSFPAHGGLSQITKRCPEALRWIVRRSMAEYDRRYPSAAAMLADLRVVLEAKDPFALKPIDLPSVSEGDVAAAQRVSSVQSPSFDEPIQVGGSPVPPQRVAPRRVDAPSRAGRVGRPKAQLTSWWSGKYRVGGVMPQKPTPARNPGKGTIHPPVDRVRRPLRDAGDRRPAKEQVKEARRRAQQMRTNAGRRVQHNRPGRKNYSNTPGVAVVFAGLLGMAVLFAGVVVVGALVMPGHNGQGSTPMPPQTPIVKIDAPVPGEDQNLTISLNGIQVSVDDQSVSVGSVDPQPSAPEPIVDAQILIVPMLASAMDPAEMSAFEAGLGAQGVDLVEDDSIELIANLNNAIGALPIDSPELPTRVEEWLLSEPFDGVLLIGSEPGQDHGLALLVMDEFSTTIPFSENTIGQITDSLSEHGYGID
ncbi:MAG: protein kinase domain-containing protein [Phycisphaerales bacterium]